MKRLFALLALCGTAAAQTVNLTVVSDTNRVIRTNFTIASGQVTGLGSAATNPASAFQPASAALTNLSTNNAAALTNVQASGVVGTVALASNITGILAISNGGTGSQTASNARTALGLGSAATNPASAFQPANATLTNLANGDGSGLTNVSGGSNPTGNGGSLTNLAASNVVGTVALASNLTGVVSLTNGGVGGTNLTSARSSLFPAYASNAGKVLAVTTNETDVEWITAGGGGGGSGTVTSVDASGGSTGMNFTGGPVTTNGTLTLGGTLAVGSGGTGAGDVTNARINLLPAYTNNAGKVLAVTSSTNDLEWKSVPAIPVAIADGGTGGTNIKSALHGLQLILSNENVTIVPEVNIASSTNANSSRVVAIGYAAEALGSGAVAIGNGAISYTNNATALGQSSAVEEGPGVAVGYLSYTYGWGSAIGRSAYAEDGAAVGRGASTANGGAVGAYASSGSGFAGGSNAVASGSAVQLGTGDNSTSATIQFMDAGTVTTNEWARIAALSTYPTTNIQVTVVGGTTNTLVFSNGILTSVTSP